MDIELYLTYVVMPIICLAMVIVMLRLIKGPQIVDRVIALDLLITIGVGFIAVFSIITDNYNFLDVAMILAFNISYKKFKLKAKILGTLKK